MKHLEKLLASHKRWLPTIFAGTLFNLLSLFFIGYKFGVVTFVSLNQTRWDFFYFTYFISATAMTGILLFNQTALHWRKLLGLALAIFTPTQILYLIAIENKIDLHPNFGILTAAYFLMLLIFISAKSDVVPTEQKTAVSKTRSWPVIFLIICTLTIHLYFGIHNIGKMAIVDEPLWTFDRIPDFWKNISDQDWYKSRVSDKPGLTTATVSGIGLFFQNNPKQFEKIKSDGKTINSTSAAIEKFNTAFRLPIFIFETLLLLVLYFFIKKLFNPKIALFSFIFIALSPILLGNSRIINPDSFLWIFSSLSLLAYFVHLKNGSRKYLYWAAAFLTLSILTKYVANFLYIFFFGLILLEYIFNRDKYADISAKDYLKKALANYGLLVIFSLALFYVLYPACWAKPSRILIGTIQSQAFLKIWPLFAGIIFVALIDLFALKAKIFSAIINFLSNYRKLLYKTILVIFLLSILVSAANTYAGMFFFDAEKILSSPKSSSKLASNLWDIYFVNFYPLIFGISPIALILLIALACREILKKIGSRYSFQIAAIMLFAILYYIGSVASNVSLTIRYQIMIFPIIFILAGIAINDLLLFQKNKSEQINVSFLSIIAIVILTASLINIRPFFMGYASELLPKKYSIDLKGMGEGSYEAAQYLNALPNAKNMLVWSDKQGVCTFFVGNCSSSMNKDFFNQTQISYFVASSDRATRTTNMIASKVAPFYDLNKLYYDNAAAQKTILIGGRSSNFIKITPNEAIAK